MTRVHCITLSLRYALLDLPTLASLHLGPSTRLLLENECTALHGVDKNVPALEESIAGPCADELDGATASLVVILGVNI
jgi:hypothetical protein